ncbi:MAG: hypothetical protein NTW28_03705 [Candidatus Solibacter sp.]|nr:hypothetical protein [Candidatus Solibacter sp.]
MSENLPDLTQVARRPLRYWNSDGLPELVLGGVWAIWVLCLVPLEFVPAGRWTVPYGIALPLVFLASALGGHWYISRLKTRITAPRGGFIDYRPRAAGAMYLSTVLASGAAVAVVRQMITEPTAASTTELTAAITAFLLSAVFLAMAVRHRMPHHLWQAAVSVVIGLALIQWPTDLSTGMFRLFASLGLVSILLGWIRLRRFLRRNPAPAGGAE